MPSKKSRKDKHFINGEELALKLPTLTQEVCCDCNLVHFKFYYMEKGKLIIKTFRDDFVTKNLKGK